jgi:hypothetical protein
MTAKSSVVREAMGDGWKGRAWQIQLGDDWQIPVIEIAPDSAEQTRIVIADPGRSSLEKSIATLLKEKTRVLAIEPYGFGEASIPNRGYLFALMITTVGERPLGIQAGQVAAVANWAHGEFKSPIGLMTFGPRSSGVGLVAAAVERGAIASLKAEDAYESLSTILTSNLSFEAAPELFCAGLLATHDFPMIRQLLAPGVLQ